MPASKGGVRTAEQLSERDRAILDVAAVAFGDSGFHGVGMDELGSRAGLSGPTLYRHFAGKDEILATLLNRAMDELMAAVAPVLDDPLADLDRALRHHVRFALEQRHLVLLHQREAGNLVPPWSTAFGRRMGRYTRGWEALVAAAVPGLAHDAEDAVAAVTQACLGTVFSVSAWPARALGGGGAEAVEERVLGLLHDGLTGLSAT